MAKRSRKTAAALFDHPVRRLVWTNRANVLGMCAAGLIWPSALYRKHYPDVSDLTPGRIPVFADRLPVRLKNALSADEGLFDVALEVETTVAPTTESLDGPGWSVTLMDRPIPWAAVRAVHVRTKDEAEDLRAREFDDLPADPWTVDVSPNLWDTESPVNGVADRLAALAPGPLASMPMTDVDRFSGGLALMRRVLPRTFACELGMTQLCSRNLRTRQLPKLLPAVPSWLQRLVAFARLESAAPDLDQHLLTSAFQVVKRLHVESGADPREIADAIADETALVAGPSAEGDIRKWASYARRVADGEAAPSSLDDSGSEVRRALILFLLRTEPARIVKAANSNLRPGPAVHSLAAFLSGFAACYSRLDREIKGDINAHKAMSLISMNRLRQLAHSEEGDEEVRLELAASDDEPSGTVRMRTTVSTLALSDRRTEPADDMKKLYFQAKTTGIELTFDPIWSRFLTRVDVGDEAPHTVFVEPGIRSRHNQPSVRFSSDCPLPGGRSAKTLSKSELLALLERNADLDMHCRFGISRTDGTLQVVAHQLVETLDVPELRAHLDAVARTAAEVTARMARAGSPGAEPPE